MTTEELRKIDAEIATKITGEVWLGLDYPPEDTVREKMTDKEYDPETDLYYPRYSTDIKAAWEVVEKMESTGHHFQLSMLSSAWTAEFVFGESATAETAPLSICFAALKTL